MAYEEIFAYMNSGIQESKVSSVLQNTRQVPVVIQLPIPIVTSFVELSNNFVHHKTYLEAISSAATQHQSKISSISDTEIQLITNNGLSSSDIQNSSSTSNPHHHHSNSQQTYHF